MEVESRKIKIGSAEDMEFLREKMQHIKDSRVFAWAVEQLRREEAMRDGE